jgi:ribose transport system substrate-binding protein
MKTQKWLTMLLGVLVIAALLAGCAPAATTTTAPAADTGAEAAATEPAAEEAAAKPYIPVISKGFQHQFWQAVKLGSEQAAADYNVDITFEGPATESEVDKQIEMLTAALAKNPAAICFAALDTQAAIPLLEEAQAKRHSGGRLRLRRGQRHSGRHGRHGQHCRGCAGC